MKSESKSQHAASTSGPILSSSDSAPPEPTPKSIKAGISDAEQFVAPFLGADEVRQIEEFATALSAFEAQTRLVTVPHAATASETARRAYVSAPTLENFHAFLRTVTHETIVEKLLPSAVLATIDHA